MIKNILLEKPLYSIIKINDKLYLFSMINWPYLLNAAKSKNINKQKKKKKKKHAS